MKGKKWLLGVTAAMTVLLTLQCEITGPDSDKAYVQFLNTVKQDIVGGEVQYRVRNITALNESWPEEVAYGSKTAIKEVTPHTGDFTVGGEIKADGGTWTSGSWDFTKNIAAGDTVVLTLEM